MSLFVRTLLVALVIGGSLTTLLFSLNLGWWEELILVPLAFVLGLATAMMMQDDAAP